MIANSDGLLRQMFSGWSSVDSYRDDCRGQYVVRLSISEVALRSLMGPEQIVDRLWPKKVRRQPFHGVRFHGRIVGKWGAR